MTTKQPTTLSDALRAAVRADERSQAEIAREAGMTPANLTRWLAGRATITLETADRLAGLLGGTLVFAAKRNPRKSAKAS